MADAKKITNLLLKKYPSPKIALHFKNPVQLLVATILSAQCTDARVNLVTQSLFQKYRTVADFAQADLKEFEEEIKPTGFYRNKAKAIINCCRMLLKEYASEVPSTIDELIKLPGVGRKDRQCNTGRCFRQTWPSLWIPMCCESATGSASHIQLILIKWRKSSSSRLIKADGRR
jgi:endonuclease-3